jgi:hypothetical protein
MGAHHRVQAALRGADAVPALLGLLRGDQV